MCTVSRDHVGKQARGPWKRRAWKTTKRFVHPLASQTFTKETRQAMFLRSLLSGACTSRTWCHARGNSFVNSFTVRWRALWRNHVALTQTVERTREGKKGGGGRTNQPTEKIPRWQNWITEKFSFHVENVTDLSQIQPRRPQILIHDRDDEIAGLRQSPSTRGRV